MRRARLPLSMALRASVRRSATVGEELLRIARCKRQRGTRSEKYRRRHAAKTGNETHKNLLGWGLRR